MQYCEKVRAKKKLYEMARNKIFPQLGWMKTIKSLVVLSPNEIAGFVENNITKNKQFKRFTWLQNGIKPVIVLKTREMSKFILQNQ